MVRWLDALAAKSNDLSAIPVIHMTEGKNQFPQLPSYLHT